MPFFSCFKGKPSRDNFRTQSNLNQYAQSQHRDQTTKHERDQVLSSSNSPRASAASALKNTDYTPPSGPPPTHGQSDKKQLDNDNSNPPPYQEWLSVPDTSQLPPPPVLAEYYSPTHNASEASAEAGRAWCERYQVYSPSPPARPLYEASIIRGEVTLELSPRLSSFGGPATSALKLTRLPPIPERGITSRYQIESPRNSVDTTVLSTLPLYFAAASNPLLHTSSKDVTPTPVSISYSVKILSVSNTQSTSIALGLASKPYPPFRQPGWHRASIGVHSDDGRRYIHDPFGGIPFLSPFNKKDTTITLTLTIHPEPSPLQKTSPNPIARKIGGNLPKCRTRVDVQINGKFKGGWDIHEEKDGESDRGVEGLQGESDLYAAIGIFGGVGIEVAFGPGVTSD